MARARTPTNRAQRVSEQIQRDLAEMIPRELRDPRLGLITLNGVEITPDYAHAKVFFTVIGADPVVATEGLNAAAGHLHHLLFKRLSIHTVPRLHFVHDRSLEHGFVMDGIIADAMAVTPPTPDARPLDDDFPRPDADA